MLLTVVGVINCTDSASRVLFDGHIPTLTGLDSEAWASQLRILTIQTAASSTEISLVQL